jgi:hypothetical protein
MGGSLGIFPFQQSVHLPFRKVLGSATIPNLRPRKGGVMMDHKKCSGSMNRKKLLGKGTWKVRQFPNGRMGVEVRQEVYVQDAGDIPVTTFFFPPFCPKCGQSLNSKGGSSDRRKRSVAA